MADTPRVRPISQVLTYTFRGRIVDELSHTELLEAMKVACQYIIELEQVMRPEFPTSVKLEKPVPGKYVKDIG